MSDCINSLIKSLYMVFLTSSGSSHQKFSLYLTEVRLVLHTYYILNNYVAGIRDILLNSLANSTNIHSDNPMRPKQKSSETKRAVRLKTYD